MVPSVCLSVGLLCFAQANESESDHGKGQLDQLRKDYLADKAALDQINQAKEKIREKNKDQEMPNSGPEWKKVLQVWLPLWQKEKASYPPYLNALVAAYCELPSTDKKAVELKNEIAQQHPEHSKNSLTVSYYERHSLLANAIMPNLYNHDLDKERAKFFVKLLKPNFNTKSGGLLAFLQATRRASGLERPDRLLSGQPSCRQSFHSTEGK